MTGRLAATRTSWVASAANHYIGARGGQSMVAFSARIFYRCLSLHNHDTGFQAFHFTATTRSSHGIYCPSRWSHFQRVGYFLGLASSLTGAGRMCHGELAWKCNDDSVLSDASLFVQNKCPMSDHGVFAVQIWANRENDFLGRAVTG